MNDMAGEFAAIAVTLYAAHHVGDYWIQTDHQARRKGDAGWPGRIACISHVMSYVGTQAVLLFALGLVLFGNLDNVCTGWGAAAGLIVSGVTHYLADRHEHGAMFALARLLPGKATFMRLGVPRSPRVIEAWFDCASCEGRGTGGQAADESTNGRCWDCRGGGKLPSALTIDDNPSLGTGAWALDQAWHIFWGVFVAALLVVAL